VIGQQFIVTAAFPRFVMFVAATIVHAALFHGDVRAARVEGFPAPCGGSGEPGDGERGRRHDRVPDVEALPGAMERRKVFETPKR